MLPWETDWWGRVIEFEECQTCREATPMSVNTVDERGIHCVLCRLDVPGLGFDGSKLGPPRWTLEALLGTRVNGKSTFTELNGK